jgi:hypothetical protein
MAVVVLPLVACGDDAEAPSDTTTTTAAPTTVSTEVPECDLDELYEVVDETLALARLEPGGEWDLDTDDSVFADRTVTAEAFVDHLALDCAVRAVQRTGAGGERLLLAAWTGPRVTFVAQATDAPTAPYEPVAMWDVSIEHVRGEYFEGPFRPNRDDRTTWAATLEGGESIIVHARDYPAGPVAKDWLDGLVFQEPEEYVSLDSERFGIDALRAAGARNVDLSELPEPGSEIGNLQFVTPLGLVGEARVAPIGWIDPTTEWHGRPVTTERFDGIEVHVSESGPPDDADILTYSVAHFTFECGEHVWHVMTGYGTTGELREFVTTLVDSLTC